MKILGWIVAIVLVGLILLILMPRRSEIGNTTASTALVIPPDPSHEIDLKAIAGKQIAEVNEALGKPVKTEIVNPSRTPCPCKQNIYRERGVEVVFINGKADWITVFKPFKLINLGAVKFKQISTFDDYTYIKVATD